MIKRLLVCLVVLLSSNLAFAEKADFFLNDDEAVNMEQLDQLEAYVNAHEGITYAEVAEVRADLVAGVSATPSISGTNRNRGPLGIPSFLWGCVFGVAGLAVVYFVADDRDETKKAFWGCLASSVVGIVLYIVLFATAASQAGAI